MSRQLDEWVVKNTLDWMKQNPQALADIASLSINLTGYSLSDTEFHDWLCRTVDESGIDPHRLCFEVTETVAIAHIEQTNMLLRGLRDRGCLVALDDFGSGLSSYGYLKGLEVDTVKIDRQFVRNVATDPIDFATVRSIHEVSKIMGKRTVAEGVEDRETWDALQDLGVDHAQGYLIHRPSPLADLADANVASVVDPAA
jgi:EAL domain-containing protein (putative c-di-GMP-specific phosphodiesterase class I)